MALRAVTDHPKFFRLKALLRLNKSCALGYLEALWHFCGKYTPQGNLGKYTDSDIEAWLEWDGDEGALIAACVKAGWLREDGSHRLIVHDWSQYADEIVHTDLARKCLRFADGTLPRTGRLNKVERARYLQAFPEAREGHAGQDDGGVTQTESDTSQTKPDSVTKPEPEPAPAIEIHPPAPQGGTDPSADELAELDEVNGMRARFNPPQAPLTWAVYAQSRGQPTLRGTGEPGAGRRRWRSGRVAR